MSNKYIYIYEDLKNKIERNELTEKVITTKFNTDISTPGLEQHILLEFLKEGLNKHINYLRLTYKKRYDKILEKLQDIPDLKIVNSIEGGYYIWLELDEKINPHDFYLKSKKQKIFLLLGNAFLWIISLLLFLD